MKLGTLLLRNAEISLTQLEAALRTQILYGGRLGTNLVELGFIDVELLTLYLSESLGVPMASQELFESVSQKTIEAFGVDRARRYEAFPLAGSSASTLPVAMVDPSVEHRVAELASELGVVIEPHVAPELRIYYYLEAHYGITRQARYVRMGTRDTSPGPRDERRRSQPAGGIVETPRVLVEPRPPAPDSSTDPSMDPSVDPSVGQDDEDTAAPAAARAGTLHGSITYPEACAVIDRADHRDTIGDALASYGNARFGATAIFLLRDNNALGWRLHHESPENATQTIEEVSLPLGAASVLQAAHDSARSYRGGPVSPGMPTERALWSALGVESQPAEMAVIPVLVRFRVVHLIYVHGLAGAAIDDKYLGELEKLATRAGAAYERLLLDAKNVVGTT